MGSVPMIAVENVVSNLCTRFLWNLSYFEPASRAKSTNSTVRRTLPLPWGMFFSDYQVRVNEVLFQKKTQQNNLINFIGDDQ